MQRFRLVLAEAVRSLGANVSTTVAATMTVLIGMFLLGFLIGLATWAFSLSDHYKNQLEVKVFFDRDARPAEINAVRSKLAADPRVKSIKFVSPQDAYDYMKKHHPDILKPGLLPYNPFGPSYNVEPRHAEDVVAIANSVGNCPPKCAPGVNKVDYGRKTARTLLTVAHVIEAFFIVAVIVLLVSSTLLIANTIRLAIFSRRREIEVMKLVGATNWFVRGPFMLEGLLTGLAGAFGAVILLILGKEIALPRIMPHVIRASDLHAMSFELIALIVIGVGLLLGAAGSGLTIRRFLEV